MILDVLSRDWTDIQPHIQTEALRPTLRLQKTPQKWCHFIGAQNTPCESYRFKISNPFDWRVLGDSLRLSLKLREFFAWMSTATAGIWAKEKNLV